MKEWGQKQENPLLRRHPVAEKQQRLGAGGPICLRLRAVNTEICQIFETCPFRFRQIWQIWFKTNPGNQITQVSVLPSRTPGPFLRQNYGGQACFSS